VVLLDDSWEVVVALVRLPDNWLTLVVLLTFSRLRLRRTWELLSALL
jgi:hypothetical protein